MENKESRSHGAQQRAFKCGEYNSMISLLQLKTPFMNIEITSIQLLIQCIFVSDVTPENFKALTFELEDSNESEDSVKCRSFLDFLGLLAGVELLILVLKS